MYKNLLLQKTTLANLSIILIQNQDRWNLFVKKELLLKYSIKKSCLVIVSTLSIWDKFKLIHNDFKTIKLRKGYDFFLKSWIRNYIPKRTPNKILLPGIGTNPDSIYFVLKILLAVKVNSNFDRLTITEASQTL